MACNCSEKKRPLQVPAGSNQRPRQWTVLRRNETCSAFNGYRSAWSDYSDVTCLVCGAYWRTSAGYVSLLPNQPDWPEKHPARVEAID